MNTAFYGSKGFIQSFCYFLVFITLKIKQAGGFENDWQIVDSLVDLF